MAGVTHAQEENIIVPNVEGVTLKVAAQILRTAGLQPRLQNASIASSAIVVRQEPRPGFALSQGSEVVLITDVASQTIQRTGESRALQRPSTGVSPARAKTSVQATSKISPTIQQTNIQTTPATSGGTPIKITGTGVYITPQMTTQQPQYTTSTPSRVLSVQQSQVATTSTSRYPVWYPKAYLPASQAQSTQVQSAVSRTQTQQITTYQQPYSNTRISVSPYVIATTSPLQLDEGWFYTPQNNRGIQQQVYSSSNTYAYSGSSMYSSQQGRIITQQVVYPYTQTSYPYTQTSYPYSYPYTQRTYIQYQPTTGAIPVPNVMNLRQGDAVIAIQKAGLRIGSITRVQNSQWRAGLVMKQLPRSRAIVSAGTQIHLWIAY